MTGLDVIARLADTTVAAIRELNPQYLRLATPPGVPSVVRIPAGRGPTTLAAYAAAAARAPHDLRRAHRVAKGQTLSGIACAVSREHVGLLHRRQSDASRRAEPPARAARHRADRRRALHLGRAAHGGPRGRRRRAAQGVSPGPPGRDALGSRRGVRRHRQRQLQAWNALATGSGRMRAGQRIRVSAPEARRATPARRDARRHGRAAARSMSCGGGKR